MANCTFSDKEALQSLTRLFRPPPPAKPVFDIIGSLPRELAIEVYESVIFSEIQTAHVLSPDTVSLLLCCRCSGICQWSIC